MKRKYRDIGASGSEMIMIDAREGRTKGIRAVVANSMIYRGYR